MRARSAGLGSSCSGTSRSELQASAILELRLRALTALERNGVEQEYNDIQERIGELRALLGDELKIDALIKEELLELRDIYGKGDDRRSEIVAAEEELELEDLIAEEDMVIAITRSGYIKRLPVTAYREQRRGGKRRLVARTPSPAARVARPALFERPPAHPPRRFWCKRLGHRHLLNPTGGPIPQPLGVTWL